ncbi:MAG: hypothetical protein LAO51_16130 [Acidobacteriia bacterium]|nr:hypothetical protein [Terriglobia bacterium]
MESNDAVRERLSRDDEGYRRLAQKHQEYDRRLEELRGLRYPTEVEKLEEIRLKKLKLAMKDQMEERIRVERRDSGA